MNKKKFVTVFPETYNVHLIKDVGAIPYIMQKEYGYETELVSYRNEKEYIYLRKEVNGLNLKFLEKKHKTSLVNFGLYIWKYAKSIDVLHLFHIRLRTLIWILIYKFRNREGKVYLKLDAPLFLVDRLKREHLYGVIKKRIEKYILSKVDLISAETTRVCDRIMDYYELDIKLVPNGVFDVNKGINIALKKDIILTVGRIGANVKNTKFLMEAFAHGADKHLFELRMVGGIEEDFREYINDYFVRYPHLKERIVFVGEISDRKLLMEEYKNAKFFVLPSRYESFSFVLLEALSNGCYLITSDQVTATYDITDHYRYGEEIAISDVKLWGGYIEEICRNDLYRMDIMQEAPDYVSENYTWKVVGERILQELAKC